MMILKILNYLIKSSLILCLFPTISFSQTPQITGILVNSCGDGNEEGLNEIVTITNGSSPLNINDINITFPNGGSYCNSGCAARTLVNNPTFINTLNALAGCTLFQFSTVIPVNATIIVFTGLNPTEILNFSSECANAPIYAIFCNNTSGQGRFANTGGIRTLSIDFGGGNTDDVSYNGTSGNTGDNGDFASFDVTGNPTYGNLGNCALPLPIELVSFTGEYNTNDGLDYLQWVTASERNNDRFEIYSSVDGEYWQFVGSVNGAGNSTQELSYNYRNKTIPNLVYYKLKQVDYDGNFEYSNIILVNKDLEYPISIRYYDLMGREINPGTTGYHIQVFEYKYRVEYKRIFKM